MPVPTTPGSADRLASCRARASAARTKPRSWAPCFGPLGGLPPPEPELQVVGSGSTAAPTGAGVLDDDRPGVAAGAEAARGDAELVDKVGDLATHTAALRITDVDRHA